MWKKALCLAVCLGLFFLSSCKEQREPDTVGGVACPVEGLEWGMTVEECLAALSCPEDNAQIERQSNASELGVSAMAYVTVKLNGDRRAYGYPVQSARLEIYENVNGLPVGLGGMTLDFGASVSLEEIESALDEQTTAYAIKQEGHWASPKTLADADPALVDAYFNLEEGPLKRGAETYPYGAIYVLDVVRQLSGTTAVQVNNANALILEKAAAA